MNNDIDFENENGPEAMRRQAQDLVEIPALLDQLDADLEAGIISAREHATNRRSLERRLDSARRLHGERAERRAATADVEDPVKLAGMVPRL